MASEDRSTVGAAGCEVLAARRWWMDVPGLADVAMIYLLVDTDYGIHQANLVAGRMIRRHSDPRTAPPEGGRAVPAAAPHGPPGQREFRDPVTGLPDGLTFMARLDHELARSRRTGLMVSLIHLDIDEVVPVNGGRGREAGNGELIELARRLRDSLRTSDTFARIGATEFAVICPDLTRPEHAMAVMERMRAVAAEPLGGEGRAVGVAVSFGVAFARDSDLADAGGQLLSRAGGRTIYQGEVAPPRPVPAAESGGLDHPGSR